jgi:DNA replicative helicase MCM subunit Mcm2 (Cdc46/Mcm family)
MEQQTISISKAGITTTLNARTSILAAANPLYGRFNPRVSPVENINLPAALLSRFDVMFLLLDTPSREGDEELAHHVTYVHMHNKHPENEEAGVMFTPHEVRQYVAKARTYRPIVPTSVSDYMVGAYVAMRKRQKIDESKKRQFSHVSPRTLLGIVRLSQALARLRFSEEVIREDVDEALRLIEISKASLYNDGEQGADNTPSSKIYNLIRSMKESGAAAVGDGEEGEMSMRRIRERVLARGFTEDNLTMTIDEYAEMNVSFDNPRRSLYFVTNNIIYSSGKSLATAHVCSSLKLTAIWICNCGSLPLCFSLLKCQSGFLYVLKMHLKLAEIKAMGVLVYSWGNGVGFYDFVGSIKKIFPIYLFNLHLHPHFPLKQFQLRSDT